MVWVVNGEHLLVLGPPRRCPPMGSAPAFMAGPAEGSRSLQCQTGGRCDTHNTHQLGRSRQPTAPGLPHPFSSALLPRGGIWPGSACHRRHPLSPHISTCGLPTGHVLKHTEPTGVHAGAGGCSQERWVKWCMSVWREVSVLIYRISKNIQALDVTQTLQHVAGSFADSWSGRGLSCG